MSGVGPTVWELCAAFCKKTTIGEDLGTGILQDSFAITGWGGERNGKDTVILLTFEGKIDNV